MREAAGQRRRALAPLEGRDPVLRVGAGGAAWAVLAAGEKKEMGKGARLLRRADLLLGWGGAGWTDPGAHRCRARPMKLGIYWKMKLSHQAKCDGLFLSQEHAQNTGPEPGSGSPQ